MKKQNHVTESAKICHWTIWCTEQVKWGTINGFNSFSCWKWSVTPWVVVAKKSCWTCKVSTTQQLSCHRDHFLIVRKQSWQPWTLVLKQKSQNEEMKTHTQNLRHCLIDDHCQWTLHKGTTCNMWRGALTFHLNLLEMFLFFLKNAENFFQGLRPQNPCMRGAREAPLNPQGRSANCSLPPQNPMCTTWR